MRIPTQHDTYVFIYLLEGYLLRTENVPRVHLVAARGRLEFLVASVNSVARLMASHVDEHVWSGGRTLVVRGWKDPIPR